MAGVCVCVFVKNVLRVELYGIVASLDVVPVSVSVWRFDVSLIKESYLKKQKEHAKA